MGLELEAIQGADDPSRGVRQARSVAAIISRGGGSQALRALLGLLDALARDGVETGEHVVELVHSAPIGHHPPGVMPIVLQNLVEKKFTAASIAAVDLIVRTHHRTRLPRFNRNFECQ